MEMFANHLHISQATCKNSSFYNVMLPCPPLDRLQIPCSSLPTLHIPSHVIEFYPTPLYKSLATLRGYRPCCDALVYFLSLLLGFLKPYPQLDTSS